MELSEKAEREKRRGKLRDAALLFGQAFALEAKVARLVTDQPGRSALLKSAAVLACECGEYAEAYRLSGMILADPETPPLLLQETLQLLQDIRFENHLALQELADDGQDFQFTLVGTGVGHGTTDSELILPRVEHLRSLTTRTAEMKAGLPYRRAGRPPESATQTRFLMKAQRAASYCVHLSLARSSDQLDLFHDPAQIISEVMVNLARLEQGKLDDIRSYFESQVTTTPSDAQAYHRNFCSLASEFLPDGMLVSSVGLGWVQGQQRCFQALKKQRGQAKRELGLVASPAQQSWAEGLLFRADSKSDQVSLEQTGGTALRLKVREGLDEIVTRYWNKRVRAAIKKQGRVNWLEDVELI